MSVFPLSAVVGQADLVEALLAVAVDPRIGGVLVRGQRGTAKTTAVRGLAPLLPPRPDGGPAPLVELPLGATLDRLVGSLDLGAALAGEHRHEPGLLARADGGILYVDEVNLLADHLVDALLDAAASGTVTVEREGVSAVAAARFRLVGTMNPEEGELRPQLLDRFGLGIAVATPSDPAQRGEIVRRRLAFEADPEGFRAGFAAAERALAQRLEAARGRLPGVRLPARELDRITRACVALGVDGVRGDIVTARTAQALAALDGEAEVGEDHVRRAAALALAHRRRRDPLDPGDPDPQDVDRALEDHPPTDPPPPGSTASSPPSDGASGAAEPSTATQAPAAGPGAAADPPASAAAPDPARPAPRGRVSAPQAARLPEGVLHLAGVGCGPAGRRARGAGPETGSIDARPFTGEATRDIAVLATLRARLAAGPAAPLHGHVRAGREATFVCLLVDASGSMGARRRVARVKGALMELLRDAYARRDRVAVITFRDARAELLVAPGAPIEAAARALRELPTGGRTPLADGLGAAAALITRERVRDPDRRAVAVVLSDGRVPDPAGAVLAAAAALGAAADHVAVIDTEEGPVRVGLTAQIAAAAAGAHHRLAPDPRPARRAA